MNEDVRRVMKSLRMTCCTTNINKRTNFAKVYAHWEGEEWVNGDADKEEESGDSESHHGPSFEHGANPGMKG